MGKLITLIVLMAFVDINDFAKRYSPGDKLEGVDEGRAAKLLELGLVKIEGKELDEPVLDIDMSGKHQTIISQVKTFEDVEKLKQYLEEEQGGEKPRASVVKALEDRLAILEGE